MNIIRLSNNLDPDQSDLLLRPGYKLFAKAINNDSMNRTKLSLFLKQTSKYHKIGTSPELQKILECMG